MKKWNLVVGNKAKAKVLSVLLAVTMSFSLFGCGQTASDKSNEQASAAASEVEAEADQAASEAKTNPSHSSESGKDETVYIVTDASGNPQNITVNDQLKNKDGAATLVDKTNLKDIINVNGDGTYTENDDGTITWDTESADVYYQGTTDKALPVTVSLSYQLDGKDIRPEDLAGKSGHVKIRFDYKNTATVKEKVGGKEEDVTVPFAMISGAILPMDKFTNVSVTNGKIMGDGQNNIVVGMAFPGLKDALDWENLKKDAKDDDAKKKLDDIDIPEYVEIEADVKDFALDMTMTMASSNILSDLGDVDDIDVSSVTDKMNDLQDGTDKLEDGAKKLKNGTSDLKDGVTELADGTSDMKDGTSDLRNGASKLKDGTSDLKDGASDLKDGTSDLKDGASTLKSGTSELKNGASDLKSGTSKLKNGTSDLKSGMQKLADGATTLKNGTSSLSTGTNDLKDGTGKLSSGAKAVSVGASDLAAGLDKLQRSLTSDPTKEQSVKSMAAGLSGLMPGLRAVQSSVDKASQSVGDGTNSQTITGGLNAIKQYTEGNVSESASALQAQEDVVQYLLTATQQENNRLTRKDILDIRNNLCAAYQKVSDGIPETYRNVPSSQIDVNAKKTAMETATEAYQKIASSYAAAVSSADTDTNNAKANNVSDLEEDDDSEINKPSTSIDNSSDNLQPLGESETTASSEGGTASPSGNEPTPSSESEPTPSSESEPTPSSEDEIVEEAGSGNSDAPVNEELTSSSSEMQDPQKTLDDAQKAMANAQKEYIEALTLESQLKEKESLEEAIRGLNKINEIAKQNIIDANNFDTYNNDQFGEASSANTVQDAYKKACSVKTALTSINTTERIISESERIEIVNLQTLYHSLDLVSKSMNEQIDQNQDLLVKAADTGEKLNKLIDGVNQLDYGASTLSAGAKNLASGAASADAGAAKLQAGAKELDTGAGTLKSGIDSANSGTGSLYDGATSLDDGAGKLYSGTVSVDDGAGSLYNGTVKLDDGAGTLYDGTVDLDNGAGDLYDGVVKLDDGAQDLYDGAKQLLDGSGDLDDGTQDLLDGIIKLNDEGIKKLTELFGDNVQDAVDRIKAVKNASIDYQTFTEVAPSEDKDAVNTVKFVYRTAAVKSE